MRYRLCRCPYTPKGYFTSEVQPDREIVVANEFIPQAVVRVKMYLFIFHHNP